VYSTDVLDSLRSTNAANAAGDKKRNSPTSFTTKTLLSSRRNRNGSGA
jgi:hypothetical protein